MKRFPLFVLALAIAALLAPDARAQRGSRGFGRGGGGGLGLLRQKSVQEELKLSPDQVEQADDAIRKMRESTADFRDLSREERQERFAEMRKSSQQALAKILNKSQQKRLKQIELQQSGPRAFADPEVSAALALTDKQKGDIEQIQDDIRDQMREVFQAAAGDRDEIRKKMESVQKSAGEKIHALLNAEQQTKWKELLGEPFEGEITRGQFRGRGRRGGGPPADQGSNVSPSRGFFRLASFKPDDDDDEADDDDRGDGKRSKGKKSEGKKAQHKRAKSAGKHRGSHRRGHRQHARGDHPTRHRSHGQAFAMRHGGSNAETWARVARAIGQHRRRHASFGGGWQDGFHRHQGAFAHHRFGPRGGFGPHARHHRGHGWHGAAMASAWRSRLHGEHGPRGGAFAMHHRHHGHHRGHGPAHFASHRPGGHRPGFGEWRMHVRPHEGDAPQAPPHFDRPHRGDHDRPQGPPPRRDDRRSEAVGQPAERLTADAGAHNVEAIQRLAQLERSLDLLAQQIEELRHSLRR